MQIAGARPEIPTKVVLVMGNGIPAMAVAEAALSFISLLRPSPGFTLLSLCWLVLAS
jgi:hypothetical protein